MRKILDTTEDFSRVDAMIAVRLRATGHSQEAVAATIRQCAPTIREDQGRRESRDWHRYAERTATYAFGVAGDAALARNERYLEHWKKIEGLVEREKRQEARQEVPQEVQQEAPRMRM